MTGHWRQSAWTVLAVLSFSAAAPTQDEPPPNVLFVVIDDLNDWVSCLGGHPQAQTPNIDRIAQRGVLFTNAHCQAPICTPSRISMMTGRLPSSTGYSRATRPRKSSAPEDPLCREPVNSLPLALPPMSAQ